MVYFPVLQNHQYHKCVVLLIYFTIAEKRKLSCPTRYDSSLSSYVV